MGNIISEPDNESESNVTMDGGGSAEANCGKILPNGKILLHFAKRKYSTVSIHIPFEQLNMIRVLQREFNYEVNGTIYVDENYKFKSFEVRTDSDECFSTSATDWKISYHTHPDRTAHKYGLRYYSPPSVDDVMLIFDHCREFAPDTVHSSLGEIMIIFANEGIYLLQVDRIKFNDLCKDMTDDDLEDYLNTQFNPLITGFVKKRVEKLSGKITLDHPNVTVDQFIKILKDLTVEINKKFPLKITYYSWKELEIDGIHLDVNTYFITKTVKD